MNVHDMAAKFAKEADIPREPEAEAISDEEVLEVAEETAEIETEDSSEETPPSDTEPETFDVPYNGETLSITLDELKKGYMRERDYQYKRGESSKIEKAAQAKLEKLDGALDRVSVDLQDDSAWFETDEAKELREIDPETYLKRVDANQAKRDRYDKAKNARDNERENQRNERIASEREKLTTAIPDWLDPNVQSEDLKAISELLTQLGYSPEEMGDIIDHRQYKMARELVKLRTVQNQDLSKKKVKKVPKTSKPGTSSNIEEIQADKKKKARESVKSSSGKLRDVYAAFQQGY